MFAHLALALALTTVGIAQTTISLRSGNAPAGLPDPQITYLGGPATSGFGAAFTSGDFAAARTGPQALVRPGLAGWPLQLPSDPLAQWIDTNGGSASALYAIPFTHTPQGFVFDPASARGASVTGGIELRAGN